MRPKFIKEKQEYMKRMQKGGVEYTVFSILKPRNKWEDGLTFKQLWEEVEKLRKKPYTENRIRQAISMHNRYGSGVYGVYIQCDWRWVSIAGTNKAKKEFRYFVPKNTSDISKERLKLDYNVDLNELKEGNLDEHEHKSIPHEKELAQLSERRYNK